MIYKTTDIVAAATLLLFNAQLQNIEVSGRKGTFVLDQVEQSRVDDFILGKLAVEPIRFHATVRFLSAAVNKAADARGKG